MSWRFFLVRAVLAVWCQKVCWQQEQGVQKCDQQWGYGSQSQSFCVWIFWGLEVCLDPLQNIRFVLIKISWPSHRFYSFYSFYSCNWLCRSWVLQVVSFTVRISSDHQPGSISAGLAWPGEDMEVQKLPEGSTPTRSKNGKEKHHLNPLKS